MEQYVDIIIGVLSLIVGSGVLSTVVKSGSWWMKIIDAVAFNWGKARNDPGAQ